MLTSMKAPICTSSSPSRLSPQRPATVWRCPVGQSEVQNSLTPSLGLADLLHERRPTVVALTLSSDGSGQAMRREAAGISLSAMLKEVPPLLGRGLLVLTLFVALAPAFTTADVVTEIMAKYTAMVTTVGDEMKRRYDDPSGLMDTCGSPCNHHLCGNVFPEAGRQCMETGSVENVSCPGGVDLCGHIMVRTLAGSQATRGPGTGNEKGRV